MLRGEDLLSSDPAADRAVRRAPGDRGSRRPRRGFGHLPYVMGQGNKKLSASATPRRTCSATARTASCRKDCSTTWPCWAGRSRRTATCSRSPEMVEAFDIGDVNPNPARFDLKKAEAINADHMRMLPIEELTHRVLPFLQIRRGASATRSPTPTRRCSSFAMPLVAERMNKLDRGRRHARLPVRRRGVVRGWGRRSSTTPGRDVRSRGTRGRCRRWMSWSTADIEAALREALIEKRRAQAPGGVRPGPDRGRPGARCRRRCSSRWSSWAATARWRAWPRAAG